VGEGEERGENYVKSSIMCFSHSVKCGDKNMGRTVNFASRINKMLEVEIWEMEEV
jgi:hypothetical protein